MSDAGREKKDTPVAQWRLRNRRHLFSPPAENDLWSSYAQAPSVYRRSAHVWTIYFSGRDAANVSRVYAADYDPASGRVRNASHRPLLDLGEPSAFDAHGVGAGQVIADGDTLLMYYTGLRRHADPPYRTAIGLAISTDGGRSFIRRSQTPVIGLTPSEPLGAVSPSVYRHGSDWTMWYSSFRTWRVLDGKPEPVYDLRRATSTDGRRWTPEADVALGFDAGHDGGLIRANLFQTDAGPSLLAAIRGWRDFREGQENAYRLMVAQPDESGEWRCLPGPVALSPAPAHGDWDFGMQAYPWLEHYDGKRLVFYNGNDFGRHGFGVAELSNALEERS